MANTITWISDIKHDAGGQYAEIYFDQTLTGNIENADKYIFEVRRYKDQATRKEHLNVKVYDAVKTGNTVTRSCLKNKSCTKWKVYVNYPYGNKTV